MMFSAMFYVAHDAFTILTVRSIYYISRYKNDFEAVNCNWCLGGCKLRDELLCTFHFTDPIVIGVA